MAKILKIEKVGCIASVTCLHPDTSSYYYDFAISFEAPMYDDEAQDEEYKQIREDIEKSVNASRYWHEVEIELQWYFEEDIENGLFKKYVHFI